MKSIGKKWLVAIGALVGLGVFLVLLAWLGSYWHYRQVGREGAENTIFVTYPGGAVGKWMFYLHGPLIWADEKMSGGELFVYSDDWMWVRIRGSGGEE